MGCRTQLDSHQESSATGQSGCTFICDPTIHIQLGQKEIIKQASRKIPSKISILLSKFCKLYN